jgi:signal transduction histidine kinase
VVLAIVSIQNISKLTKISMDRNRLFNRTRSQLTSFYAVVIGLITLVNGYAIHRVMLRTFERTVDRELNTLAGTVHDSLEAVLQQPGVVSPVATNILPGLCIVGGKCSPIRANAKLRELTKSQGYSLQLLDLKHRTIATLGTENRQLTTTIAQLQPVTIADDRGGRYHVHTFPLKTSDDRDWGYLQVAQSYHRLDEYMQSLHLLLIFGVPLAMLIIGGASWWLSGLAMRPIYQSYQQIQQFTADAAHELRTPLAVTRVAVESALDPALDRSQTHANLEIAQRQVRHLTRLAEDLLWLSRLEAKQLPLSSQSCCLNDLVSDLEEELAPLAMANGIDLQVNLLVRESIYVRGDIDRLYRAIANLITNAIQYTPAGSVVTICLECTDDNAIVTVTDTGIGIAPQDLPQIFDRFYRVCDNRSRATGGTGLGLAIANAIVRSHQGTIRVSSELDRGSVFTVLLKRDR